jgi:hypothetical protein
MSVVSKPFYLFLLFLQCAPPKTPAVREIRAAELDQHHDLWHAGIRISDCGARFAADTAGAEIVVLGLSSARQVVRLL